MNYDNQHLAKAQIVKQIGYFPAFFLPIIDSSLICHSLVQRTLYAYINNPLPTLLKEKLFVYLSYHCGVDYFTICHSCSLYSLGMSAKDILALVKIKSPQIEEDLSSDLHLLEYDNQFFENWHQNVKVETSLLRCSSLIFLHPLESAKCLVILRQFLDTVSYNYLLVFLGYIKLCHQWIALHPEISHQQDNRSQLHLGSLLLEEIELAKFFQSHNQLENLQNDDGATDAILHTSSDIPNLAATQEVLSQRTLQLEAANRELESFSYSVSHDLQAPLRVINGFSQVLWNNYQSSLDNRARHYLQRIQANSQRMSNLIDALLQLSRVTRSQMKTVTVNLSEIALDIIEELQGEAPERQIEFEIASNLIAKGDPQLLRIVLSNLLNNAWKYTSKRSLAKIEFNVLPDNKSQSTYYVRDNGAGFDLEYAGKLFTAFKRLHSQQEFPGTGIGLATVQRIIYRHGGRVWAEGECDHGATIYFSL